MENDKNVKPAVQEETPMSIRDIWNLCINHWKWFVLSVVVCLAAASFYILRSVPVYSRSSSVLIKEDRRSGSVTRMSYVSSNGATLMRRTSGITS